MTPLETVILDALSNGKMWSSERLLGRSEAFLPTTDGRQTGTLKTVISHIRKKLPPTIRIEMAYNTGYKLTEDGVSLLATRRIT